MRKCSSPGSSLGNAARMPIPPSGVLPCHRSTHRRRHWCTGSLRPRSNYPGEPSPSAGVGLLSRIGGIMSRIALEMAELAGLIGDTSRANILAALMDGRALTALELSLAARVTPQTASSHLAKLRDANLLSVEKQGRHRYFRLASPQVARALEALMTLTADGPPRHRARSRPDDDLAAARTCYD